MYGGVSPNLLLSSFRLQLLQEMDDRTYSDDEDIDDEDDDQNVAMDYGWQ